MAIIEYKCDKCNRTIMIPQNRKGIEVFNNCIITAQCKGTLQRVSILSDYIQGGIPATDTKYEDWAPRKILFTTEQKILSNKWIIKHSLNNQPDIVIYGTDVTGAPSTRILDFTVNYTSLNTLEITFPVLRTGIIQCIARYDNMFLSEVSTITSSNFIKNSWNNGFTLAIAEKFTNPVVEFMLIPPAKTSYNVPVTVSLFNNNSSMAWGDASRILIAGVIYKVYTIDISTAITNTTLYNNYSFYINKINNIDAVKTDCILLISNGITSDDKNMNNIVDCVQFKLDKLNNISNNELYISESVIKSVYPPVMKI